MRKNDSSFFRVRFLFSGGGGKFSKRAFFFTLFGFLAALYFVGCAVSILKYNQELGIFLLGCNATFGLNYFANEKGPGFPGAGKVNAEEGQDGPQ
jgi:hypothetical protein